MSRTYILETSLPDVLAKVKHLYTIDAEETNEKELAATAVIELSNGDVIGTCVDPEMIHTIQ